MKKINSYYAGLTFVDVPNDQKINVNKIIEKVKSEDGKDMYESLYDSEHMTGEEADAQLDGYRNTVAKTVLGEDAVEKEDK